MKKNQLPITLQPKESTEIELTLTPEAIKRLNSGEAFVVKMSIAMPLPIKCILYPLAYYGAYVLTLKGLTWLTNVVK